LSPFKPVNMNISGKLGWRQRLPHLLAFVVVASAYALGGLEWIEHKLLDSRFELTDRLSSGRAVHVGIDSRSLRELDTWPWPRSYHANLIRRLDAAGAAKIVVDIDLSSRSNPAADADLAAAIAETEGKVVLPMFKQRATNDAKVLAYTEPLEAFRRHAQVAAINVRPESDSLIRRYNRLEPWNGTFVPSLATQLSGELPGNLEPFYMDFGIRPESIHYLSYVDALQGRFAPTRVKDKVVIIGAAAVELGDMLAVPVHGALSGPALQIIAYDSLFLGRAIERSLPAWTYLIGLILALFLGPQLSALSWQRGLLITVAAATGAYTTALWLQAFQPVSFDIALPVLVVFLSFLWSLAQQLDLLSTRIFKQHMADVHRRALMGSVVDESFEGIVLANGDGRIDFANPVACELLGRSAEDLEGRNVLRFLPPEAIDFEGPDLLAGETETRVLIRSSETELAGKDGRTTPIELSIAVAQLAPGRSPFERRTTSRYVYIYTFRDIRQRLRAEATLRAAADKAIEADRAKSELVANVSHELRTPLNAIIGFSEVMRQELYGPLGDRRYQTYVKDILNSGEHLLDLVNNLLAVSRLDSSEYKLSAELLNLREITEAAWNVISGSPDAKAIEFEVDIPEEAPRLFGSSQSIRQVLLNLMGNASKFTPEGGAVRVSTHIENSGEFVLTVADNGIGISKTDLPQITDPFLQVDGSTNRKHGGVGLGLHIVKRLVELHDGGMPIESELGAGTRVVLRFPRERVEGFENVIPLPDSKSRGGD